MADLQLPQNPYKRFQTGAEAASFFGISEWTLRRWRLQEGCPVISVGGRFLFCIESVESWLKSRETSGHAGEEPGETGVIRSVRA